MELTPLSHQQLDRRLRDIDAQIHRALRDIRRNLEGLEQVSHRSGTPAAGNGKGGFANLLRDAMEDGESHV